MKVKRGSLKGEVGTFMSRELRRRLRDSVEKGKTNQPHWKGFDNLRFFRQFIRSGVLGNSFLHDSRLVLVRVRCGFATE